MNIVLQCDNQYHQILKRYLNLHFSKINYIQDHNFPKQTIYIKQICSIKDLEHLKTLSSYQLDFVFLIENGEHMFELLEYNPLTFIRVTHIEKDIYHFIEILQYKEKGLGNILNFKSGHQNIRIHCQRIEYVESYGHYLFIHSEGATFKIRERISNILKTLKPLGFIQIHKSYIINSSAIYKITSTHVYMNSHTCLPIGNKYKAQLKNEREMFD